MVMDDSLEIIVPASQFWNERKEEFVYTKETKLILKHSLISISKWEAKWKKPFLSKDDKTSEMILDYVKCMCINTVDDDNAFMCLSAANIKDITEYINDPMTATWFSEQKSGPKSKEVITSELIYYWMIAYNIPQEYQKWHLNRLMTLIKICGIKNAPPKKRSSADISKQNAAINAARRRQLNTTG